VTLHEQVALVVGGRGRGRLRIGGRFIRSARPVQSDRHARSAVRRDLAFERPRRLFAPIGRVVHLRRPPSIEKVAQAAEVRVIVDGVQEAKYACPRFDACPEPWLHRTLLGALERQGRKWGHPGLEPLARPQRRALVERAITFLHSHDIVAQSRQRFEPCSQPNREKPM